MSTSPTHKPTPKGDKYAEVNNVMFTKGQLADLHSLPPTQRVQRMLEMAWENLLRSSVPAVCDKCEDGNYHQCQMTGCPLHDHRKP